MSESPMFTFVGAPYLEYLPVVDLATGRLLGMEALVRWQHPQEGRISPNELIPQAEATGDIAPLTRWVLMEACNQARQWSPSIQLGVNCTVEQLRRGEVSKAVADALEKTGLRSGQLTLEVTEDAVVDPVASADLRMLSDIGVQLSVDDVGTNWSSFEPFRRHNISTVKIDGSFIAGLERSQGINRLVVETVIHMAHSLAMSALVEAVETPAQVSIVREFNADAAQGFFFARPMSSEDAALFGAGPEVPQFSRTELRTLMRSHPGPIAGPDEVESTEVVAAEVSAAAVRRYGAGSALRRVSDNLTAADDATAADVTVDRSAADDATDNATDNATADPTAADPTTADGAAADGAAADGAVRDDGASGGVAASNGTGEPVRGGGVVFANDGDREELDSLPHPSEDDDETLPHPFSSPLAINPLRHEAV
ncbi:MAG: EAL domain-containing protein [Acidimicrobiales bacterium]